MYTKRKVVVWAQAYVSVLVDIEQPNVIEVNIFCLLLHVEPRI